MEFTIDFNIFKGSHLASPWAAMWFFFSQGGWILFFLVWLVQIKWTWIWWRWLKFAFTHKWIFLAIDVPRENEQSTKAVEQIFVHISGSKRALTYWEKWWHGMFQIKTSFELVSVEGYVQFVVRVEERYRDLVEAAIYAQYPESEITEIEDYTKGFPSKFPNDTHDLWGTEYVLDKPDYLPIRTYPLFEHQLTQIFVDPMAAMLEMMASLGRGEYCWYQIVCTPLESGAEAQWVNNGLSEISRRIGRQKQPSPPGIFGKFMQYVGVLGYNLASIVGSSVIYELAQGVEGVQQKEEERVDPLASKMLNLPDSEKLFVNAIEQKIAKAGWRTKIRVVYIAEKDVFEKQRILSQFHGALKQYNSLEINGFTRGMHTRTSADYLLAKWVANARRVKIMQAYRDRENTMGENAFILNVEELASLWHFPTIEVKAPLVKKVGARRAEPPAGLPGEFPILPVHLSARPFKKAPAETALESVLDTATFDAEPMRDERFSRTEEEEEVSEQKPKFGKVPSNLPIE